MTATHDSLPGTPDGQPTTAADEIDRIPFSELGRFFAAGRCRLVDAELDFPTVVQAILDNDARAIEQWIANDQLRALDDEIASEWFADNPEITAAVIAPWVLIHHP